MCTKDSINKTCWKNGKDLSNGAPKIKLWNLTKKTHFLVFAKNIRRPWMKLKNFFCQFPNPWTLRVSGMGGYTSNCEKKSKSLHPIAQSYMTNGLLIQYMGNYLRISSYIRKPFLIYYFATTPFWISLYMRKIWFSFFQCSLTYYALLVFSICILYLAGTEVCDV
jgi:hypothetical protein